MTLSDVAELVWQRRVSPLEVTRACLRRIDDDDPLLHAFVTVTSERALSDAKAAEADIARGRYRGPLHGIPVALKDNVRTKGIRTTANSKVLRDLVPDEDAAVLERLSRAGAVLVGKTVMFEFAYGMPGPDRAFDPALNPWDPSFSPGGSSSGSAVAVAAGMCFGAIGTDTGGSIRQPAAACGVVGMKPTFGRVSTRGVIPLAPSFDHVGPMTRALRDNAVMLQAIAGHDPADPFSLSDPVPDLQERFGRGLRGVRVGVPRRFIEDRPHEPECLSAFDAALGTLRELGAVLSEFDLPSLGHACELGSRLLLAEAYAYHRRQLESAPESYDVHFRQALAKAADITPAQLREADAMRVSLVEEHRRLFATDGIDVIASLGREGVADAMADLWAHSVRWSGTATRVYDLTGMPALVMPMGFGRHGLPLGIQLAADRGREDVVYQVGAAFEDAKRWTARRPPRAAGRPLSR